MDGVLLDSFEAWLEVVNAAARHFGHPPVPRERFRAVYGQPTEQDVAAFFPSAMVQAVDGFYAAHFAAYAGHARVDAEAARVLAALRERGVRTAVITNTAGGLARRMLADAGLATDAVVGGDDVPHGKPAPDMVHRACALLGVTPSDAIVVGDSRYDYEAATSAGVRFAGMRGAGGVAVRTLPEVITLVDGLNAAGGQSREG